MKTICYTVKNIYYSTIIYGSLTVNNIFSCKEFRLHIFSFSACHHSDNMMGIPIHYFARMRKGTARIVTADKEEFLFRAGDVFYLPKGLRYRSHWIGNEEEGGIIEWESYGLEFLPCPDDRSYKVQKLEISTEEKKYLDLISENMLVSAKNAGYLYLFLDSVLTKMTPSFTDMRSTLAEKAKKYIEENESVKVSELSKYCNVSESGIYNFFRDHLKTTPIEYKNRVRVERAKEMLRYTSASVEEISTSLGFSTTAYFRKVFKAYTGTTPMKIRKDFKHI